MVHVKLILSVLRIVSLLCSYTLGFRHIIFNGDAITYNLFIYDDGILAAVLGPPYFPITILEGSIMLTVDWCQYVDSFECTMLDQIAADNAQNKS